MVVRWKQLKNIRLSPISLILKCDSIIFEMHVNSEDSHVEVIFSNIMHHWKVDIMDKLQCTSYESSFIALASMVFTWKQQT